MTSNQSDLRESMDAGTTGSSPPDQCVKLELDQTLVNHLGASVALSIMAGLALVLVRFGAEPSPAVSLWMIGLSASHLFLWLIMPRHTSPGTIATTAIAVYTVCWSLAGPLFINTGTLVDAILSSTVIIILSAICPLMYL